MRSDPIAEPAELGFDPVRLARAFRLLEEGTRRDLLPAAGLCVGRSDGIVAPRLFGRMAPASDAQAIRPDAQFLIASITKPVTVMAVMLLVERGAVTLDDRVAEFVPAFGQNGKQDVRLRHLMTHTSGLPDMLPNNDALRASHAPLSRFIDEINRLELAFVPGTQVSYQSMGIAMLSEVVHQVAGATLAEFLRAEVFGPLAMTDTSLGWQPEKKDRIAAIRVDAQQSRNDWNWNSPYWLNFGAPWGGLITTPLDFSRLCRLLLKGGTLDGVRVLSPATVRAMGVNQLAAMPAVPELERRCRGWGLGWRLNWPAHRASFGDLVGPRAYGHWGSTGTLCWIDPDADAFFILFTTQPGGDDGRHLARVSNAVASALI